VKDSVEFPQGKKPGGNAFEVTKSGQFAAKSGYCEMKKLFLLGFSHLAVALIGFGIGIYALPILTAPPAPTAAQAREAGANSLYSGQFRRDLEDSDALHWGEGTVFVSDDVISLEGKIAPGPDYRIYLSPQFVETEADFLRLKASMVQAGEVKTFENFVVPVQGAVDSSAFNTIIIWCESFGQFITSAQYQ